MSGLAVEAVSRVMSGLAVEAVSRVMSGLAVEAVVGSCLDSQWRR